LLGELKNLTVNPDGTQNITVTVQSDFREAFDELREKPIEVEIKRFYKRRSLDANSKCWVMIDQLAEKLHKTKTEVYCEAIKDLGGVSVITLVKNEKVDALCDYWHKRGLGWLTEVTESDKPEYKSVTLWAGSSVYNTYQMSSLIDILIQMCNEQGIPTMTEDEVQRVLSSWDKKVKRDEQVNSTNK